jgi:hypothetical protein
MTVFITVTDIKYKKILIEDVEKCQYGIIINFLINFEEENTLTRSQNTCLNSPMKGIKPV